MLISSSNEKKTALSRFVDYKRPLIKVQDYSGGVWGLYPRNKEQNFAMNLLLDDDVPMITLLGRAGSGKTLCAVAAGLEKVLESNKEKPYRRLVITRPIQPLGKDLGYLPGSLEEKMSPWLKPIQDNLVFLLGNDRGMLEMQVRSGTIDIEAMTYIRGRSIANAFIIVDEAQNMTQHELKTVITRVGENSKLVLTGDIEQIDNPYLDETSNGLTCAVEKFKNHDIAGHILFDRGERSKLATLASKIL
jgi:PhoH-like ATPase